MTTIELYRKHKAGQVSKNKFLYEVRKDANLPWVTNLTSYDDAVKILKNNRIISEAEIQENPKLDQKLDTHRKDYDKKAAKDYLASLEGMYKASPTDYIEKMIEKQKADMIKNFGPDVFSKEETLNEVDNNVATDPAVDRVNPYYLKRGVQMLLNKEKELTNDSYIKALNKAALMLQKNPHAFDEEMFANAKDVEKADTKLETQEVKKANHKDKANEMKKVKVKALKEAAIGELKDYLKKKEQINEDSHWKHNIGSEVHTPDGEGKIVDIVGSTFTVEMEDGTRRDYQINTVDHFTQKAQEELPVQKPQPDQTVKDMWASWDKDQAKPFSGMVGSPEQFKKPLDLSKLKEFIAKHKGDKDKMGKLKEAIKKLKEMSPEEIDAVKKKKGIVNVPASATADIETLKKKQVNFSTY